MDPRDLIRALMLRGLTQSVIAERTGIPQPTISKVVRGEVKDIMSRSYRKLLDLHELQAGAVGAPMVTPHDPAALSPINVADSRAA
jgi:transcriptional regulator with XRE-family HTH domain